MPKARQKPKGGSELLTELGGRKKNENLLFCFQETEPGERASLKFISLEGSNSTEANCPRGRDRPPSRTRNRHLEALVPPARNPHGPQERGD